MLTEVKKFQIDKYLIPTMVIRLKDKDILNIPTQIGCPVNCSFCSSAKSKFIRNLTSSEMSYLIESVINHNKKTLISFTGEGESVLNHKNVNDVISRFDNLAQVDEFRVCISGYRCCNLDKIEKPKSKFNLQLSLHSMFDEKRSSLMEKTEKLEFIFDSIERNISKFSSISANYVLVEDFNDSDEDLELLSNLDKKFQIKLNPLLKENGEILPNKNSVKFFDRLKNEGFNVFKFCKVGSSMQNKLEDLSYSLA